MQANGMGWEGVKGLWCPGCAYLCVQFIPASLANTAELWVICPKSCCLLLQIAPTQSNLELLLVSRFSLGLSGRRELSVLTRSVVEGFVWRFDLRQKD